MKRLVMLTYLLLIAGCGYEAVDSEMVGQVKKVMKNTPLICPNYTDADISLGVFRNGVGSTSTQDVWVWPINESVESALRLAVGTGSLVKITYDTRRLVFCGPQRWAKKVEILK